MTPAPTVSLDRSTWEPMAREYWERAEQIVRPHLERRSVGVKHPVHDFLFVYYSYRPVQLTTWHPGFGSRLLDAPEYATQRGYAEGAVTAEFLAGKAQLLRGLLNLLRATAGRSPNLGCFGLHEWAMVHRLGDDETRHADWPLRLGGEGTDQVVESHRIACSHFDAYRFFTPSAVELNTLRPTATDRPDFEQPGCLHATMDLYKHAFRLAPLVPSDLVLRCFELARDVRVLDMRASPYDLADLGFEPVAIETAEGKRTYAARQEEFALRAAPLRTELIEWCERLLAASEA